MRWQAAPARPGRAAAFDQQTGPCHFLPFLHAFYGGRPGGNEAVPRAAARTRPPSITPAPLTCPLPAPSRCLLGRPGAEQACELHGLLGARGRAGRRGCSALWGPAGLRGRPGQQCGRAGRTVRKHRAEP